MEVETVGRLIAYVVVAFLALDRGWSMFRPPLVKEIKETNGKLTHLQEEVEKLHRERLHTILSEILEWSKDIHEDIDTLKTENSKVHNDLVKTLINTKKG